MLIGTAVSLFGVVTIVLLLLRRKGYDQVNAFFLLPMSALQMVDAFLQQNLAVQQTVSKVPDDDCDQLPKIPSCHPIVRMLTTIVIPSLLVLQLLFSLWSSPKKQHRLKYWLVVTTFALVLFATFSNQCSILLNKSSLMWMANEKARIPVYGFLTYFITLCYIRSETDSLLWWMLQHVGTIVAMTVLYFTPYTLPQIWDIMTCAWSLIFLLQFNFRCLECNTWKVVQYSREQRLKELKTEIALQSFRIPTLT
jgi:hypothetical protein